VPDITDAALTIIHAALQDADLLDEHTEDSARRVAQYLISSGYTIAPDIREQHAAA
jgi:vacuolar-type H+-ATPase subunit H